MTLTFRTSRKGAVVLSFGRTPQALFKVENGVFKGLFHELRGVVVGEVYSHWRGSRGRVLKAEGRRLKSLTGGGSLGFFLHRRVLVDAINVLMNAITLLPLEAHQRFQLFALPSPGLP